MIFSKKTVDFILKMREIGKATRSDFRSMGGFSYYVMTSQLRKNGIIMLDGISENSHKIWVLTPLGQKLADKLKEVMDVLKEIEEGKNG